ncbi:MAG: hypothetical protein AAGA25_17775, partial [Planctomycetota bacterium]
MSDFHALTQKHAQWKDIFSSDDASSIVNQSIYLVYDFALFNLINESRKLHAADESDQLGMNGYVHHFIDRCFIERQVLSIRRLTDRTRSNSPRSICRLISDIKSNTHLITRENYFKLFEVEYDVEFLKQKESDWLKANIPKDGKAFVIPSSVSAFQSSDLHKQFDMLSGAESGSRSLRDTVSQSRLSRFLDELNQATDEVKNYADRYVAHATKRELDKETGHYERGISIDLLARAQHTVLKTVRFIGIHFI